jgi:hypothetical protein
MGIPASTLREWAVRDIHFPARKVGRHWLINILDLPRWWQNQSRGDAPIFVDPPSQRQRSNAEPAAKTAPVKPRTRYPNPKPITT